MQPPADPNRPRNHSESSAGTVVLIGASIRSAAQSAKRAGFHVLGIDHFGDVDTRQACHEFSILNEFVTNPELICRFRKFPHFVVGGINAAHDLTELRLYSPANETGSKVASLPSTSDSDCWDNTNWLEKMSAECGLSFPNTFHSRAANEEPPRVPGKRWLRKMKQSCGGLGVRWHTPVAPFIPADSGTELVLANTGIPAPEDALNRETRDIDNQVFQEWIPGRPHGATFICNGKDCRLLGVCRSLFTRLGDLPFVYRGSFGPVSIPHALRQRLQTLGLNITRESGHRGLLNIDLVINRTGKTFVLEVNPRWSGSSELIERWMQNKELTDSLFGSMLEACDGSPLDSFNLFTSETPKLPAAPWSAGPRYLKQIVFARHRFQFSRKHFALSNSTSNNAMNQPTLSDFPAEGTWISAGEPICTLVSQIPGKTFGNSSHSDNEKGPMHQHWAFLRRLLGSAHE